MRTNPCVFTHSFQHLFINELIYCRYRQVHDFWHVLVDLPPSVVGEIALKYYEWKVTGLPIAGLSTLLGPLTIPLKVTYSYSLTHSLTLN